MNKLLPILLVVVLSGCASTKIISSSDRRINIEYNPAKVTAGDLITMGHEHCSKLNMNVSNFISSTTHDCSYIGANYCAISFMCSDKYIFSGDDYRIIQNRINIDRERMSENSKLDDVDWKKVLAILSRNLDKTSSDFNDSLDRTMRESKQRETDFRLKRIEDKIR
tara:strand:- start:18 stop:515 length:498 start_codon:yes stop_codon:yes gene_type:complete